MANPIIDEATRVIVADDDEDERSLVVAALRDDGYDVRREACDGAELLMMIDDPALRPDVVVTDVKMPRLSGLGVLHKLRGALSVPVVVMTGLTDGFDPDDGHAARCGRSAEQALRRG